LWLIYSSCLVVRESRADAHRRARVGAVFATVAMLDVPLVAMATRWFRGIHPVSPQMEPSMRVALAICVVCFTAFFSLLLVWRKQQLQQ
jgi:heme exporter protein C